MKKGIHLFGIIAFALFMLSASTALAAWTDDSRKNDKECNTNLPDMSEEQKEEVKKLKDAHFYTMHTLNNQLDELKAQLRILEMADNADMVKVNKVIDLIGLLKIKMDKELASHKQKIRMVLTQEQRVIFDQKKQVNSKATKKGRKRLAWKRW